MQLPASFVALVLAAAAPLASAFAPAAGAAFGVTKHHSAGPPAVAKSPASTRCGSGCPCPSCSSSTIATTSRGHGSGCACPSCSGISGGRGRGSGSALAARGGATGCDCPSCASSAAHAEGCECPSCGRSGSAHGASCACAACAK
uniref:Uncharacterized protein n=1 Tax=Odontella aurita TaxID=265563 RepID=A0A7S4MLE7_9STRA